MADLRDINLKFSGAISDLIIDNPADLAKLQCLGGRRNTCGLQNAKQGTGPYKNYMLLAYNLYAHFD